MTVVEPVDRDPEAKGKRTPARARARKHAKRKSPDYLPLLRSGFERVTLTYSVDVVSDFRSLAECLPYSETMEAIEPKIVGMGGIKPG